MKKLLHTDYDLGVEEHHLGVINAVSGSLLQPEDKVTTEQFITMIVRSSKGNIEPTRDEWSSGYIDYALYKGIIMDYDMTNRSYPIERRAAARIVHEALMTEFLERDEEEWRAAEKLMDLYSCRTCVMHIAQVYVKGIMLGHANNVFDVRGNITLSEATEIVVRMLNKKKRIPLSEDRVLKSKRLRLDEVRKMMLDNKRTLLIDVRTKEEYKQGHMNGSICIPLQEISNNPYSVGDRKDAPIILYCQKGYKSSLAAQILIDAGYNKIYTIPGIEQI